MIVTLAPRCQSGWSLGHLDAILTSVSQPTEEVEIMAEMGRTHQQSKRPRRDRTTMCDGKRGTYEPRRARSHRAGRSALGRARTRGDYEGR
jgi:hypothetical protein